MIDCETTSLAVGAIRGLGDIWVNQIGVSNAGMTYSVMMTSSRLDSPLKDVHGMGSSLLGCWDFQ